MFTKGPLASHNFLKITIQKNILKAFFTSTYITTQSSVGQGGLRCQKEWLHNFQGSILQIDGGIIVPELTPEVVGQWND